MGFEDNGNPAVGNRSTGHVAQTWHCDDRNCCHSRYRHPADNSDDPYDSSHGQPQLDQAQTLPLAPSSPSFRAKSKSIKTNDPDNLSKITTPFQATTVSPRLFLFKLEYLDRLLAARERQILINARSTA